jgi:hypothetical protein
LRGKKMLKENGQTSVETVFFVLNKFKWQSRATKLSERFLMLKNIDYALASRFFQYQFLPELTRMMSATS